MTRDAPMPEPGPGAARRRPAPRLERSNARLYVLAEVSHAFATVATDYDSLLAKIARTTADLVGDGCNVTLIDNDGETLINAANAHRDPGLEADYRDYLAGVGVSKPSAAPRSRRTVARTGIAEAGARPSTRHAGGADRGGARSRWWRGSTSTASRWCRSARGRPSSGRCRCFAAARPRLYRRGPDAAAGPGRSRRAGHRERAALRRARTPGARSGRPSSRPPTRSSRPSATRWRTTCGRRCAGSTASPRRCSRTRGTGSTSRASTTSTGSARHPAHVDADRRLC